MLITFNSTTVKKFKQNLQPHSNICIGSYKNGILLYVFLCHLLFSPLSIKNIVSNGYVIYYMAIP